MSRYISKITGFAIIIFIVGAYITIGYTQTLLSDVPIVSDEPAKPSDSLRVVGKDEHQRIVNELALKIQKLDDRIATLEREIRDLRAKVEE